MTTGLTPPLIRAARAQDEDVATRLLLESGPRSSPWPSAAAPSPGSSPPSRSSRDRCGHTATWRGCRRGAGEVVAAVHLAARDASAAALYVDAVATAADQRRAGVASALLDAALADARERGRTHLALETELENAGARSLYGQQGFGEAGRLPPVERGLGEGGVCLVRAL